MGRLFITGNLSEEVTVNYGQVGGEHRSVKVSCLNLQECQCGMVDLDMALLLLANVRYYSS